MSQRYLPQPMISLLLLITWMLLFNSVSPGVILLGAVFAIGIPLLTNEFRAHRPQLVRPAILLSLVPRVLFDILVANVNVARLVLFKPRDKFRPAFLRIELELKDPYGIAALASIITLTPGTVSSVLSDDRRVLYVHALDTTDPEAEIATIRARYEKPLKELLEC